MHMLVGVLGADATETVSTDRFALARFLVEQRSIDERECRTAGAQLYVGEL
jgi:hypothetical protein